MVYGKMTKRLHKEQNLQLKYKTILNLAKGQTNKEVAQLFGVSAKTLSTWKNNKDKIRECYDKKGES